MSHMKELFGRHLDRATWSLINVGHLGEEKRHWVCCTGISLFTGQTPLAEEKKSEADEFTLFQPEVGRCHNRKATKGGLEKPRGEDCGGGGGPVMGFAKVLKGSPPPRGKSSNPSSQFSGSLALYCIYCTTRLYTRVVLRQKLRSQFISYSSKQK